MSKHTPGPWEVVQHNHADGDLWLSVNQSDQPDGLKPWIAVMYITSLCSEHWANARLIAAAPELLEAAKLALATLDHALPGSADLVGDLTVRDALIVAIAKAERKEPNR